MPEHVHLLVSEPERSNLAVVLRMLKQIVSRKLHNHARPPSGSPRYYDFNVCREPKLMEELDCTHRNPVQCGLVTRSEDWTSSTARHYATGEEGAVEIESRWTARRREQLGVYPMVRRRQVS
jgi:REP-associated tyrosine transposase